MTSEAITSRIVAVDRTLKETLERAARLSSEIIVAVDQCKSEAGLTHADLDAVLFAASELNGAKEQAIALRAQLRKLQRVD